MTEYEMLRAIVLLMWSFVVALVLALATLLASRIRRMSGAHIEPDEAFEMPQPLRAENDA